MNFVAWGLVLVLVTLLGMMYRVLVVTVREHSIEMRYVHHRCWKEGAVYGYNVHKEERPFRDCIEHNPYRESSAEFQARMAGQ